MLRTQLTTSTRAMSKFNRRCVLTTLTITTNITTTFRYSINANQALLGLSASGIDSIAATTRSATAFTSLGRIVIWFSSPSCVGTKQISVKVATQKALVESHVSEGKSSYGRK